MKCLLIEKRGKRSLARNIEILDKNSFISLSKESLKVLEELREPQCPKDLAKKLKMHEQKLYYHIRKLEKAGFIEVIREESVRGAVKKYYALKAEAFGMVIEDKAIAFAKPKYKLVEQFFYEFIKDGVFDGSIVVGSPLQHGPFLTSARDSHYAIHLAMFLGNFCETGNRFIVKLDTEVKAEDAEKRNMIVIGGPITNIIAYEINEKLKVKFKWEKRWKIYSEVTRKEYYDENCCLIAKIKNPWDKSKVIILLAGLRFEGTKAAVIAITKKFEEIFSNYKVGKDFYCVVKGLDRDGDGKIDDINILEKTILD